MSLQQNINKYWDYLEQKYSAPKYVGQVKCMKFKDLKKAIDNKNENYLKKIIKNMYVNKEAYILKKCATKNLKKTMLDLANYYMKNRKPTFWKIKTRPMRCKRKAPILKIGAFSCLKSW